MKEIGRNETCPCGRGKKYKNCCKKEDITWFRKEDGTFVSNRKVPIPEEFRDSLRGVYDRFYELFGREPNPDDLISYDAERHSNSYYKAVMPLLRESGISESWIYAMYRTGGLIPTEMNEKYLSQHDLDSFAEYVEEYDEIIDEIDHLNNGHQKDGLSVSVPALVMIGSKIIDERAASTVSSLLSGFNYFLNYLNKDCSDLSASPGTLVEYASFVAIRAIKTVNSISKLLEISEPVSIYALGRSFFESYVYLRAINCDDTFFSSKIQPSLSFAEYGFEIEDGNINYRKIKADSLFGDDAPTRRSKDVPRLKDACEEYGTETDEKLRKLFYRYACQFVHIDALTARSSFYEPDLYLEFDESSIATVCALSMATILLWELAQLPITPGQQRADLFFLAGKLASGLCDCFMILVSDREQSDEMYEVFLQRLIEVETNTWKCRDEYLAMRAKGKKMPLDRAVGASTANA